MKAVWLRCQKQQTPMGKLGFPVWTSALCQHLSVSHEHDALVAWSVFLRNYGCVYESFYTLISLESSQFISAAGEQARC